MGADSFYAAGPSQLAVLDDDPTGVQTLAGVRVLMQWPPGRVATLLSHGQPLHLLTNSRALDAAPAREVVAGAAAAVGAYGAHAVLRGDSTLRGHVLEEYLGVREGRDLPGWPSLVLALALPSAGRVTVGGVQYLERSGQRVPVHLTEYARDGVFSYTTSRLLRWVEERSQGLFEASNGTEVDLATTRRGPDAISEAILDGARTQAPAAISVDAETAHDVAAVASGIRLAIVRGADVILRCGPAVAGELSGTTTSAFTDSPQADQILIVCGSFVPQSTRQLEALAQRYPGAIVEVPAQVLASEERAEPEAAAQELMRRLHSDGLAVLTTPRDRPEDLVDLASGLRIAHGLARIIHRVETSKLVTVLKGGVTSAVVLRHGLGAVEADIEGPVLTGVALWTTFDSDGHSREVLVVPGNVGDDDILIRLIELTGPRALA
jgi:uncharacterized protein YgbK (DUF1537 family)